MKQQIENDKADNDKEKEEEQIDEPNFTVIACVEDPKYIAEDEKSKGYLESYKKVRRKLQNLNPDEICDDMAMFYNVDTLTEAIQLAKQIVGLMKDHFSPFYPSNTFCPDHGKHGTVGIFAKDGEWDDGGGRDCWLSVWLNYLNDLNLYKILQKKVSSIQENLNFVKDAVNAIVACNTDD